MNYLYRPEDLIFISNTVEAIKIFHDLGYIVIIITNQAGIAKGYYKEQDVKRLHNFIDEYLLSKGTYIDSYYYCPHHPNGIVNIYKKECECRKPNIGMIKQAERDFKINLCESFIIGDKEIDVQTGKNAGIGKCILVKSGHVINEDFTVADRVYNKLYDFAIDLNDSRKDQINNQLETY